MPVDLGADTRAVLRDAGFSDDAIGDFVSKKVVFDPSVVCSVGHEADAALNRSGRGPAAL
jgi:hypothetical protein